MSAAAAEQKDEVAALLEETLAALDRALAASPDQLKAETHEVLQRIVRLRNPEIERRRRAAAPEERVAERATLDQVNVALSLIIGVEYPIDKMDRSSLEQAKGVLQGLVATGRVS